MLQTGRYTVTNVRFHNLAVLPSSRIGSDIVAQCDVHNSGETWDITRLSSGLYTIANHDHFSFVGLSGRPHDGDNVSAGYGQEWIIRSTGVNDRYIICPVNTDWYWGLADGEIGTPITLTIPPNNPKNQWIIAKVSGALESTTDQANLNILPAVLTNSATTDIQTLVWSSDTETAVESGIRSSGNFIENPTDDPLDLTGQLVRRNEHASAHGGFSAIWEGVWHRDSGSYNVAIKVLRAQNEDGRRKLNMRLRRELKIWRRLHHENVLPLCGVTSDFGPHPSMVCPWMENGPLNKYLEKFGNNLSLLDRFKIISDVLHGLAYLHSSEVIHGDLTGSNVLLDGAGKACLSDFGLSVIVVEFLNTSYFSSNVHGAVRWAAPEVYDVQRDVGRYAVSPQSDVYSFGSVVLQTLTGKPPYHYLPSDVMVIFELHQGKHPRRPEEAHVTDDDWEFMLGCWDNERQNRPSLAKAREFVAVRSGQLT